MPRPRDVVILGGGIGGLSAAWELSRPERRDTIGTVTVYQRGWRLGGKGASGRGEQGRIEEHGLHVWLGYYENAFRLVRECYQELDRPRTRPQSPIVRWEQAFHPASTIGLGELHEGHWRAWTAAFDEYHDLPGDPGDPGEPGERGESLRPVDPVELVRRSLRLIANFVESLAADDGQTFPSPGLVITTSATPPDVRPTRPANLRFVRDAVLLGALGTLSVVQSVTDQLVGLDGTGADYFLDSLEVVVAGARSMLEARVRDDDAARRTWQFLDLLKTIIRGIVVDGLMVRPEGYEAVDHLDYREWLLRHGVSEDTLQIPLVRGIYDLVFGYEDGDESRPRFAAGTGLMLSGKLFFEYRGAIFWKMTAGMGDVVFAPLYEALRSRGVEFRFFHRVDQLRVSADGRSIDSIDLGVQARARPGAEDYDPLIDVRGLPCWPAAPRHEQLEWTEQDDPEAFESFWSSRPDVSTVTLRRGADYDDVVLAIPVGMHPHICAELIDNPRTPQWRPMVEHVRTAASQAMQLWLTVDEETLRGPARDTTTTGYPGVFHTSASMTSLLDAECWRDDDRPAALTYFCHALVAPDPPPADDHGYPARERARVREEAVDFLRHDVGRLWPGSVDGSDFRWELLHGDPSVLGEDRIDTQYLRANVDPSDRYVLSLPGSARYRLRSDGSGYDNLWLAGDWTDNGLNAGCIEAAVVSGIMAANGVASDAPLVRMRGDYPTHRRFRGAPVSDGARP